MTSSALVVGTGLLGTSTGLALTRGGWSVWLQDRDERACTLAASLGAGRQGAPQHDPDVVIVAVPPSVVARVVHELSQIYVNATFTDLASVKTQVQQDVERFGPVARFVGGHPLAGRERSGPEAARADLFDGRPWVLCPPPGADPARVDQVSDLIRACGGQPVVLTAQAHDEAVARVSHVPQIVASALAAQLVSATPGDLALAGQGLRDTARIAGSDTALWTEILTANAAPVSEVLGSLIEDLAAVSDALTSVAHRIGSSVVSVNQLDDISTNLDRAVITALLTEGRRGIARVPGKHGTAAIEYEALPVVIPDEPGALARLLVAAGEAGINVEDLSIEHSPGQPVGLVELFVLPGQAAVLAAALSTSGWSVH